MDFDPFAVLLVAVLSDAELKEELPRTDDEWLINLIQVELGNRAKRLEKENELVEQNSE